MFNLLSKRWYRAIRVAGGCRSFMKNGEDGTVTYALIRGNTRKVSEVLLEQGYTEEFI